MTTLTPDAVLRYKLAVIRDANAGGYLVDGTRAYHVIDGKTVAIKTMGLQARQTLCEFQRRHALKVTGVLDAPTRALLIPPTPVDPNAAAARWMAQHTGPLEQFGANSGPWLNAELDKVHESYMHTLHAPYCIAMAFVVASFEACHLDTHTLFPGLNGDYCPSVYDAIASGRVSADGRYKLIRVNPEALHEGDLVILRWGGVGSNPKGDHGVRARTAAPNITGGRLRTIEANTGSGPGGNQSDGDGMWTRDDRLVSQVAIAGRLVRVQTAAVAA